MSEPILGLDLGTSTCLACVIQEGKPFFIRPDLAYAGQKGEQLDYPGELLPSAFCAQDGRPVVGHRALEQLSLPRYAPQVVQAVKRLMSLDGDLSAEFRLGDRTYSPSAITSEYVKVLVRAASIELGRSLKEFQRAVVTVPAHFSPRARAATLKACALGGLREDGVLLVDEPVAAAYSLKLHERPGRQRMLVIDLGGGTFDVALWEVGRDAGPFGFAEIGRDGDNRLGGLDWDREIADWVVRAVRPKLADDVYDRLLDGVRGFGFPPPPQAGAPREPVYGLLKLFQASEFAKLTLSQELKRCGMADPSRPLEPRRLPTLHVAFRHTEGPGSLSADMPSADFFHNTKRLLDQCVEVCERLFHDVRTLGYHPRFGWADLDCIFLAGGGSRLPTVARRFAECAGKSPTLDDNPQHAVAKGAAWLGELWRHQRDLPGVLANPRSTSALGLLVRPTRPGQDRAFHAIIPRNMKLPFVMEKPFPVLGDPRRRALLIEFAQEEFHHDGPAHEKVAELRLEDLPPPLQPGPEAAQISIECGIEQAPTFHVEFRGRSVSEDLNTLCQRYKVAPYRNGTPPSEPTDTT